jgi:hypothetical protein
MDTVDNPSETPQGIDRPAIGARAADLNDENGPAIPAGKRSKETEIGHKAEQIYPLEIAGTPVSLVQDHPYLEFRKLDVNIRDNDYVAGKSNITAIVIRNTYPNHVRIISVTARHSSLNALTNDAVYRGSFDKEPQRKSRNTFKFRVPFFGSAFEWRHDSSHEPSSPEPLYITAEDGAKLVLNSDVPVDREVYVTAKPGSEVVMAERREQQRTQSRSVDVSPSSEIVSEYTWSTTSSLLFIPSRIGIDIEIQYSIQQEIRSQVVSSVFDIKPPIQSVVFGGIAGGFVGTLARTFTESDAPNIDTRFFIKLIGSCLLSIMAVVSLSRKSGSQSFITVEDFFGAFVLGSLIGYQGTSFFEKTVIDPKSAKPTV